MELGVDLAKLAVLQVGADDIAANSWQGPAGGGHHVAGALIFPGVNAAGDSILDGANRFSVVIRNLAGVPERKFTWERGKAGAAIGRRMGMAASVAVTNTMSVARGDSG
jgi:hypothetical protein